MVQLISHVLTPGCSIVALVAVCFHVNSLLGWPVCEGMTRELVAVCFHVNSLLGWPVCEGMTRTEREDLLNSSDRCPDPQPYLTCLAVSYSITHTGYNRRILQEDTTGRYYRRILQEDPTGKYYRKILQEDTTGRYYRRILQEDTTGRSYRRDTEPDTLCK
jgi:hypothetical protein